MKNPETVNELWAWIEAHTDLQFERLYNSYTARSARVMKKMDAHMDYLIGASDAQAARNERNFGC